MPSGYLYLEKCDDFFTGCIALRRLDDTCCEMKRLYVRPTFRTRGIGKLLVTAIISKAAELGYSIIKLDTLRTMREAVTLYKALGFTETDAYTYNPSEDVVYLELVLT